MPRRADAVLELERGEGADGRRVGPGDPAGGDGRRQAAERGGEPAASRVRAGSAWSATRSVPSGNADARRATKHA